MGEHELREALNECREDLSDARSGWESAAEEVRQLDEVVAARAHALRAALAVVPVTAAAIQQLIRDAIARAEGSA